MKVFILIFEKRVSDLNDLVCHSDEALDSAEISTGRHSKKRRKRIPFSNSIQRKAHSATEEDNIDTLPQKKRKTTMPSLNPRSTSVSVAAICPLCSSEATLWISSACKHVVCLPCWGTEVACPVCNCACTDLIPFVIRIAFKKPTI